MIALQIIYKCAQPTLKTLAKSRQMKQFKEAKRRADIINMSTQRATILSQISRESREQTTFLDWWETAICLWSNTQMLHAQCPSEEL